MVVDRAQLPSSETPTGAAAPTETAPEVNPLFAAVIARSDETRLLLRGLLRLHGRRVIFEGASADGLGDVPVTPEQIVLLLDADSLENDWERELRAALGVRPGLRSILIAGDASAAFEGRARAAGAVRVLVRPFAIAQFVRALQAADGPRPNS